MTVSDVKNAIPPTSLAYRSDVEGLRAVAILLVVAAHAGVSWAAGGFIGVDVFYVLSGYLITGLLLKEVATTGTIRLSVFFARRLRRLLPALLLVLVTTGVLGYLLLPPGAQPAPAIAAAAAALWISNFYFALERIDYFEPASETNLFLHTWSLGVEEQFYLVWPVVLVAVWKVASSRRDPKVALALSMWLIFIASLVACVHLTKFAPQVAFYMMPTRAWQFALGALVFLKFGATGVRETAPVAETSRIKFTPAVAGWLGLGSLVVAAIWFKPGLQYPGAWALLPSLGAAGILAAGAALPSIGVARLLSLPPLQFIGGASYSWYLWHWPVLLLGAQVVDVSGAVNRTALVALSFVVAIASHRLVEQPIRRNPRWIMRPGWAVLAAFVAMVLTNVIAVRWHNAARDYLAHPEVARYERVRMDAPLIYALGCDEWYHSAAVRVCEFGPSDAKYTAVAVGDSIGLQWFPAMHKVFDSSEWRLLVITKSACPMVNAPIFYERIGREYTECAAWRQEVLSAIGDLRPAVVLLGSSYTYDFDAEEWLGGTRSVLESLSASAGNVYVLRPTPALPFDGPMCLAPRGKVQTLLAGRPACQASAHDVRRDQVNAWIDQAAIGLDNVGFIDMNDEVCPGKQCSAERGGLIVYRDAQHLTTEFTRSLTEKFADRLRLN